MRPRLVTFGRVMLLAAFGVCGAMWACSYAAPGGAGRRVWVLAASPGVTVTETAVVSARGRLVLGALTRQFPGVPAATTSGLPRRSVDWFWGGSWVAEDVRHQDWYGPAGFQFGFSRPGPGRPRDGWTLYVPWWFLCAMTAAPAAHGIIRDVLRRRRDRRRLNLCRHCGYDLRATPGRCPECGTITAA